MRVRVEGDCDNLATTILATRDDWKTVEKTWSPRDSSLGWRQETGDAEVAIAFRPPEALEEDAWQWRARVQTGGVPTESPRASSFKVDVTPPAEIEGLRLQRRPDGGIALGWDPVTQDVEGRPETIDHYVVYRYDRRGTFPQGMLVKIGESRTPSFIDRRGATAGKGERPDGPPLLDRDAASGSGPSPEGASPGKAGPAITREADTGDMQGRPSGGGARTRPASPGARRGSASKRPAPAAASTIYYKIVAVDIAGNELGLREGSAPAMKRNGRAGSPVHPRGSGGDGD